MVSKKRKAELFECWWDEQYNSWRDDCEEFARWREFLTAEEQQLAAEWDRETPMDMIDQYLGRR